MKKDNDISTSDLTLIMEGLRMVIMDGKNTNNYDKVASCQQLIDRLSDYAQKFFEKNKLEYK